MKLNDWIIYLLLQLSFVAGNPVDLNSRVAPEARDLERRTLNIVGENSWYCWAVSSGVLSNPGYAASLANLHTQIFVYFNVFGNVGPDTFKFTSSRNLGVIWTAEVVVFATTQAFTIADAVNDLFSSLNVGSGIARKGGTAAVTSVTTGRVGALIEMVSMVGGGGTPSVLKRDPDDTGEDMLRRAGCNSGSPFYNCCTVVLE
ncbi:hypothetical protein NQ176_g7068 [Zarea fungicola]|uniref:Uncharacterized protein n=1 Tax=Zarea fungicola TaxID=93591 RepID=A0ACC1N1E4_9HYPO|nr:hypothetical protein NQ176_g7068 [Lecanicillium fungicola]